MKFYFSLEGTEVTDPIGWDKFKETLYWDELLRTMLIDYEGNLIFTHDGYDLLRRRLEDNGYCDPVTLDVQVQHEGYEKEDFFTGKIFLTEAIHNISKGTFDCPVQDESYYSKIHNNKNVKCFLRAPFTKNGVAMDETITADNRVIRLYDPPSGASNVTRLGNDIFEGQVVLVTIENS